MGLFDFLKPRKDPVAEMMENNPDIQRAILWGECEFAAKQSANLRAVGRKDDADQVVSEFLKKVFQEFRNEPQNPEHLSLLANAAIKLGALEAGKIALETVVEGKKHFSLDLTLVYTALGRIYHQLGTNPEREFWCYERATEAKAPRVCKFPATRQHKAKAHQFACWVASRLVKMELADSHEKRARELVPEVNWDDPSQVNKFMLSE